MATRKKKTATKANAASDTPASEGTPASAASEASAPAAKTAGKQAKGKRAKKRSGGSATAKKAKSGGRKPQKAAPRAPKRAPGRRGRRYSDAERTRMLATAEREGLSGLAAAKRFGVSALTIYNWRKKAGKKAGRGPRKAAAGRRPSATRVPRVNGAEITSVVREEIRRRLGAMLPQIIAGELDQIFGRSGRRGR